MMDFWQSRMATSLLIIATLVHRPITDAGMSLITCVTLVPEGAERAWGEARLLANLDDPCMDPSRRALSVIILLLGSLGIPLALGYLLWRNRQVIRDEDREDPSFRQLFLLFQDFRPERYYWSSIEMGWSVVLIAVTSLFSGSGPVIQLLAACLVLISIKRMLTT